MELKGTLKALRFRAIFHLRATQAGTLVDLKLEEQPRE